MKTNLEKWNYYLGLLNEKASAFMDTINPLVPSIFYKVELNGKINECTVLNRHYSFGLYFNGKKPTNKDIEKIEAVLNNEIVFTPKMAYFDYSYVWGIYEGKESTSKTAIHIKDVFENGIAFLSFTDAEIKSKEIIEKNAEEKLFKETHKKDANYKYSENGYKFLGWENGWKHEYYDEDGNLCSETGKPHKSFGYSKENYPEYRNCIDVKHKRIEVSHNSRGSENTVSCPICKIYWKYDCSD
jgi:hypothetical protein